MGVLYHPKIKNPNILLGPLKLAADKGRLTWNHLTFGNPATMPRTLGLGLRLCAPRFLEVRLYRPNKVYNITGCFSSAGDKKTPHSSPSAGQNLN